MDRATEHSTRKKKNDNNGLFNAIGSFYAQVINGEDLRTEEDKMIDTIRSAHEEWRNAEDFFQNVTEPDLVDYAIYRVEAARTRYTYLMKLAREMGVKADWQ
ncbi:YaaL family protein [Clostridiaceae bacterium 35-E11]